jgi:hypothetical protein
MTSKFLLTLTLLALIVGISACIKPIPEPSPDYKLIPIDLQKEELSDGSVRLRWTKIKSSDFIKYWVGRSIDRDSVQYLTTLPPTQIFGFNPNNAAPSFAEVIQTVEDIDSTSFLDTITVFNRKVSYRIFAEMNGRVLSSNSVKVEKKVSADEIQMISDDFLPIPERQTLLVTDRTNNNIVLVNPFAAGANIFFNQFMIANRELEYRIIGTQQNDVEVLIPNNGSVNIRSFSNTNNFAFINTFLNLGFNSIILSSSVIADSTNLFINAPTPQQANQSTLAYFAALRTGTAPISNTTFSITPSTLIPFFTFRRAGKTREAISIGSFNAFNRIQLISWTPNGVININRSQDVDPSVISTLPFIFSKDNAVFLSNTSGTVFNKNTFQKGGSLSDVTKETYRDYVFSDDGTRIYALRNGGTINRANKKIDVFKYPSLELEKTLTYVSNATRLFVFGNRMVLFGRSPNIPRATMIERITL